MDKGPELSESGFPMEDLSEDELSRFFAPNNILGGSRVAPIEHIWLEEFDFSANC